MSVVEQEFHQAVFDVYLRAKRDFGYNASRFLEMLSEHGGLQTARLLLNARTVSEGYTALWERNGLEVTVEAVMLDPKWRSLFTNEEIGIARRRLSDYGFDVDKWEEALQA